MNTILETVAVGRNFVVILGESWSWSETEILPYDIMQLGTISGVFTDHLQIISPISYEIVRTDGGAVRGEQYRFYDVPAGTEIKLVLTPELQTRIGHPSGAIIIQVK